MDPTSLLTDGRLFMTVHCLAGDAADREAQVLFGDMGQALTDSPERKDEVLDRLRTFLSERFGEPSPDSGLRDRWARRLVADVGAWMTIR